MAHAEPASSRADRRFGAREPRSVHAALAGLLLVGLSLVLSLGAAELVLRAFPALLPEAAALRLHWQDLRTFERQAGSGMTVADDELGYVYRPHHRGRLARQDLEFEYVTDARGFRNVDPWPSATDIVAVGARRRGRPASSRRWVGRASSTLD